MSPTFQWLGSNVIRFAVVFLAAAAGFAMLAATDGAVGVSYWAATLPTLAAILVPGALLSLLAAALLPADMTRAAPVRAVVCSVVTAVPAVLLLDRLLTTVDRGPNAGPFDPTPFLVIVGVFGGVVGLAIGWRARPWRTERTVKPGY
jgi:hypothetical protein